jgi:hypothetical protein
MIDISEDGSYFSATDGKVHADGGVDFYTDDGFGTLIAPLTRSMC